MSSKVAVVAFISILLIAAATLIRTVVDIYQTEAQGIPMPTTLKLMVLAAGALTIAALYISVRARVRGR